MRSGENGAVDGASLPSDLLRSPRSTPNPEFPFRAEHRVEIPPPAFPFRTAHRGEVSRLITLMRLTE